MQASLRFTVLDTLNAWARQVTAEHKEQRVLPLHDAERVRVAKVTPVAPKTVAAAPAYIRPPVVDKLFAGRNNDTRHLPGSIRKALPAAKLLPSSNLNRHV